MTLQPSPPRPYRAGPPQHIHLPQPIALRRALLALAAALSAPAAEARARPGISSSFPLAAGATGEPSCGAHQFIENWTANIDTLRERAAREEGLDPARLSRFARVAPKVPRSEVRKLLLLNRTKVRNYTFMGRLGFFAEAGKRYKRRRQWVRDFARDHFKENDVLKVLDRPDDWVPLGLFDHSFHSQEELLAALNASAVGGAHILSPTTSDYWPAMSSSYFAFAPGGHDTFSYHAIEAIAAMALPVIKDPKVDWNCLGTGWLGGSAMQAVLDMMHFVKIDSLPAMGYRDDWVKENFDLFLHYFTFMYGDNEPPGLRPCRAYSEDWSIVPSVQPEDGTPAGPWPDPWCCPDPRTPEERASASRST